MEWFPWYPALYRNDTLHLTAEQDGIYRRLIDHYMETAQPLPESTAAMARIVGVDLKCYEHAWSILQAYFKHAPGTGYFHTRCDKVLSDMMDRNEKAVGKAKNAAIVRWQKFKQKQAFLISEQAVHLSSKHARSMLVASGEHSEHAENGGKSGQMATNVHGQSEKCPPDGQKVAIENIVENQEDVCYEHAPSNAQAMLGDATVQYKEKKNTKEKKILATSEFDKFWNVYPKKVKKGRVEKMLPKILETTSLEEILKGAERYAQQVVGSDPHYILHPSTWLNDKGWLDEPVIKSSATTSQTEPDWRQSEAYKELKNNG